MLSLFVLFVSAGVLVTSQPEDDKRIFDLNKARDLFEEFKTKFDKKYESLAEHRKRLTIFAQNLKEINRRNSDPNEHAEYGINRFTDLTLDEFLATYTGLIQTDDQMTEIAPASDLIIPDLDAPDDFDWGLDKNAVTPVKYQGGCGSCWAFSIIGAIESQYAIKYGKFIGLSEQQLVSCDRRSYGCNGGFSGNAQLTLLEQGGVMSEEDYPYEAKNLECKFDKTKVKVKLSGYRFVHLSKMSEDQLKVYLYNDGPISIALNVTGMQHYKDGVVEVCEGGGVNHGVVLVGYGIDKSSGVPFWNIKNSWGTGYGEKGYFRIKRGINACNFMNNYAAKPFIE